MKKEYTIFDVACNEKEHAAARLTKVNNFNIAISQYYVIKCFIELKELFFIENKNTVSKDLLKLRLHFMYKMFKTDFNIDFNKFDSIINKLDGINEFIEISNMLFEKLKSIT